MPPRRCSRCCNRRLPPQPQLHLSLILKTIPLSNGDHVHANGRRLSGKRMRAAGLGALAMASVISAFSQAERLPVFNHGGSAIPGQIYELGNDSRFTEAM